MAKDNVFAVLSLSGGNDGLNTVIPYKNGLYRDFRPNLGIPEEDMIPITDELAFNPQMAPLKKYWDEGKMAIFLGVGYPTPSYSHFRSMDIWHTCEPNDVGDEGWLGRVLKELDPSAENVLTGVNFGRGLPRALAKEGVPVASVAILRQASRGRPRASSAFSTEECACSDVYITMRSRLGSRPAARSFSKAC